LSACAYSIFIILRLSAHAWDPSVFVGASEKYCDPALVPSNLTVTSRGYDGQFYYRLALNPFTRERTEWGIMLDNPAYRQQRIIYPLIVWILSFGQPKPVLGLLILANLAAVSLIGWIGAKYAKSSGLQPAWGLVFSFYPGFLLTLARDLTEIVSILFLLSGLYLLRIRKKEYATAAFTLAVLSRESAVLFLIVMMLVDFARRVVKRKSEVSWYVFLIPLIIFGVWQVVLLHIWGPYLVIYNSGAARNTGPFLSGFMQAFTSAVQMNFERQQVRIAELALLIGFTSCVFFSIRSSKANLCERISFIAYFLLALFLVREVWIEDWAFLRALSELYLFGWVIILASQFRFRIVLLSGYLALWFFLLIRRY
jgi:hypothetical protein